MPQNVSQRGEGDGGWLPAAGANRPLHAPPSPASSFEGGKIFARRQSFWDAFFTIIGSRERDWLMLLLQLLIQARGGGGWWCHRWLRWATGFASQPAHGGVPRA